MCKVLKRVWAWISNIYAVLSMLGWWAYAIAVLGAAVTALAAWLTHLSPIQMVFCGLVGLAVVVFILERYAAWRLHRQRPRGNGTDTARDYICEAIEHVAKNIDDSDSDKCYPTARRELRKAAFAATIKMWGKRELEHDCHSDLRTLIPKEYWDDQELNALSTSIVYSQHEHTQAERAGGFKKIGSDRAKYWDVRVNMQEIKALWP